jgi:hypothetical protein
MKQKNPARAWPGSTREPNLFGSNLAVALGAVNGDGAVLGDFLGEGFRVGAEVRVVERLPDVFHGGVRHVQRGQLRQAEAATEALVINREKRP